MKKVEKAEACLLEREGVGRHIFNQYTILFENDWNYIPIFGIIERVYME